MTRDLDIGPFDPK